jgi:hypothetical protein
MVYKYIVMPLSLCIPTIDRWSFLSVNLPKYLANPYIDEIVVSDENGNDARMIKETFSDPKLRVYVNETRLGPFFNKCMAISLASNSYVCLMDSDNYAPVSYFEHFYNFLDGKAPDENTIYAPSFTTAQSNHPGFNFRMFNNILIDKTNYKSEYARYETLFNTGNYISSKSLHQKYTLTDEEIKAAKESWAVDVLYSNYLLITKSDAKIVTVPEMAYDHIVHDGSMYTQTKSKVDLIFYNSLYK